MKFVSFYLERFQRYSVWKKVELFGPLCTGAETEVKWLYLICIFIRVVRMCI